MKRYKTVICKGELCRPGSLAMEFAGVEDRVLHTIDAISYDEGRTYYLTDGWKNVRGIGPCCPRCLKEMGLDG